jgi:signal-transduction protein with cAMP-binding, CBS, and nucleotidyltransferase domain
MESLTANQLDIFRQQLKKFAVFTDEEWDVFTPHLEYATYKKKEHFAVAGKVCHYYGFILHGSVRYYYIKDGVELTGYFNYENEFISSYKSFLTGLPALNYIQALEPSQIILVSKKNMDLMLSNPILSYKIERFGRLMAEYILMCYEDRTNSFITQNPEQRYLKLLESGKDILQKVPQHYIANYLGITAVSLSRIRNRISKDK